MEENNLLVIKDLSVKFSRTELLVLNKINFKLKVKEIVAILGPSGCGKTTILNTISGLLPSEEATVTGKVQIKDQVKISTVFQQSRLLPWRTVVGNVAFGLEAQEENMSVARSKALKMLELVDLIAYADYYPSHISVGMQQRVNFARAIACDPDLLLLDEPFSALDIKTKEIIEKEFLKIIREKNITALFVTHNVKEAISLSDKIVVLSKKPSVVKKIYTKEEFSEIEDNTNELYE